MSRAPIALALGLALGTGLLAGPASAQVRLVAIGNDFGRDHEPRLRFAERDAERVAQVLRELGRVSAEHETVLRGADAELVRGVLLRTNAQLRAGGADALIVYYSGHADAEGLHLGRTTMPFAELKTIVESSPARVRVLILDSCRSGGITQVKGVVPAEPFSIRLDDRVAIEGMAIITSSSFSEDSQESETLRASFFTHHLVAGLRGAADADADDRVTIGEAYSYAYRETLRSSGRTHQLQHPTYAYDLKGKGDYVLTHLEDGSARAGVLAVAEPGAYLVYEQSPEGPIAAEVFVDREGARLVLPAGVYFVQRRAQTSYREYRVALERSATLALAEQPFREIRYSRLLRKGGGARDAVHTVSVMGGARGPILDGYGLTPQLFIGYGVDLRELSLGLQLRGGRSASLAGSDGVSATAWELGARLKIERYIDFDWVSLGVGALVEGLWLRQGFESAGSAPGRDSAALGFGLSVALERAVADGLVLRVEGGPLTYVLKGADTEGGAVVAEGLATPLTGWLTLGAGWRF